MHPCDNKDKQLCSQICNKKGEKHECSCEDNFELEEDGKTCVKVHPCDQEDMAGCQHKCTKLAGDAFKCSCRTGFLLKKDNKTCETGELSSYLLFNFVM